MGTGNVTTDFTGEFSPTADYIFAVIVIICLIIGLPGNALALKYFLSQTKDLATCIYIFTTINDMLICATSFPVILSFVNQRDAVIFGNFTFCAIWGIVWKILPFLSVFLVAVLSLTRTLLLLKPLRAINKHYVIAVICGYGLFITTIRILPNLLDYGDYVYNSKGVYCWEERYFTWYKTAANVISILLLAFPIIPIIVSCGVSTYLVLSSIRVSNNNTNINTLRKTATVTIVMFTVVYIIFNIPNFVNYVIYITCLVNNDYTIYNTESLYFYAWNFTYIICVVANAGANPVIYFWRMRNLRTYIFVTVLTRSKGI